MMRVSLMNLGDAPRVFHNRLNRPVVVPTGRVVVADLSPMEIQNLKFPAKGETVLVGEPDVTEIPVEMQGVVDLLAVIDFESETKALAKFLEVIPPGHATDTRPSRMQMRRFLHTMVEDYVAKMSNGKPETVHDDEDPRVLEDEIRRQNSGAALPPVHPLEQVKRDRAAEQVANDRPIPSRERAPAPVRTEPTRHDRKRRTASKKD